MKMFALIRDGVVLSLEPEVLEVDGQSFALADRMHPDVVAGLVGLTAAQAKKVEPGWLHDGSAFTPPPEPRAAPPPPEPTKAELMAQIEALLARVQALPA